MVEDRWRRVMGALVVSLGIIAAVGSGANAGSVPADASWEPPACGGGIARTVAARSREAVAVAEVPPTPTRPFELTPRLDATGTLVGQRLELDVGQSVVRRTLDLPAESFAAGVFGHIVLVGFDDGTRSRLQAFDVVAGCAWAIADATDVIRRATLSPDGVSVYETRVDRSTRLDLGVWRRWLDGTGLPRRVVGPIEADERFGRTWSTEFAWSTDGDRLAVQSCGAVACRTRILDPQTGGVQVVADPAGGPMVGLTRDRLIAYGACRGLPCRLESTDLATGHATTLTIASGVAVVVGRGRDARVVHEWRDALGDRHLRRVDVAGDDVVDLGRIPPERHLDPDLARRLGDGHVPTIDEVTR
jgi:hypothetical protein